MPPGPETLAKDPATIERFVIDIGVGPLRDHRLQMRRLETRDIMLRHRHIRHAPQPDVAVRPILRARPFDGIIIIFGFLNAPRRLQTGAFPHAAPVHPDANIALRNPDRGIDGFMIFILQCVGIAREKAIFQTLLLKRLFLVANALVVKGFAVNALAHDDGMRAVFGRAKDIGADRSHRAGECGHRSV